MKRFLLAFVLLSFCINAEDNNNELHVLIMQSPAQFIDYDKVAASAQQWAEQYLNPLNESEVKVVASTLQLGKSFSAIDAKMRMLIQQALMSTCSLYQVITSGKEDPQLAKRLEAEIEEFSKLRALHSLAFHEWESWTTMLSVSQNKNVVAAIEAVNEAIRVEIENALAQKEWQMVTARVPAVAQENMRMLSLLSTLCANSAQKNIENEEPAVSPDDSVILFDMIARTAENGCERSFETIEASSQILTYETLLLEISCTVFAAYLQALQDVYVANS